MKLLILILPLVLISCQINNKSEANNQMLGAEYSKRRALASIKDNEKKILYKKALNEDGRFANVQDFSISTTLIQKTSRAAKSLFNGIKNVGSGANYCRGDFIPENLSFVDNDFSYVCIASICEDKDKKNYGVSLHQCTIKDLDGYQIFYKDIDSL